MTDMNDITRRKAESMKVFADGDESFCIADWKAWEAACEAEKRFIHPAEFKKLSKDEIRKYIVPFSI